MSRSKDGYYFDPHIAAAYDAECARHAVTRDDVPFYVNLARTADDDGQTVLELGCGTGRVTLPIAAAGVSITGIDSSPAMLDVARARSGGADNPRWRQDDMASFQLEQRFGLVIIPFRSFQHLLSTAEQRACLRRIHDHLLPGGRLALNLVNPAPLFPGAWPDRASRTRTPSSRARRVVYRYATSSPKRWRRC